MAKRRKKPSLFMRGLILAADEVDKLAIGVTCSIHDAACDMVKVNRPPRPKSPKKGKLGR